MFRPTKSKLVTPAARSFCHKNARQQVPSSFDDPTTMIFTGPVNGGWGIPASPVAPSEVAVTSAAASDAAASWSVAGTPAAPPEPGSPAAPVAPAALVAPAPPVVPAALAAPALPVVPATLAAPALPLLPGCAVPPPEHAPLAAAIATSRNDRKPQLGAFILGSILRALATGLLRTPAVECT